VVRLASYAPLFAHVDAWQWTPDLIWYDNLHSYGTPNYYVQKLFSTNLGSRILPVSIGGSPRNAQNNLYVSASLQEKSDGVVVKAVNYRSSARAVMISLGDTAAKGPARVIVLASDDLKTENSLDQPVRLAPVERSLAAAGAEVEIVLPAYSLTVLRMPIR
jgi:alpha-N-arabinofuranosidase